MRLNRMGIPAPVLRGEVRKYKSVHTVYNAILIREIMTRINISFWARAKGGTDDLGNKWKPLSPSTHAYKPYTSIEKKGIGKRVRGLLTPALDKVWRVTFFIQFKQLSRKMGEAEAKEEAAKRAWEKVKSLGAETKIDSGRVTDINIRTGALVAATYPGKVANNRYYPPKNQQITVKPRGGFKVNFLLPYIKEVDAVRPVIPEDITPWVVEAHEIAILEAKQVYDRIALDSIRKRQQNGTTDFPTDDNKNSTKGQRNKPGPKGGRNNNPPRS